MAAHKVCDEHVPHGQNETPESPSRDPKHGQNDWNQGPGRATEARSSRIPTTWFDTPAWSMHYRVTRPESLNNMVQPHTYLQTQWLHTRSATSMFLTVEMKPPKAQAGTQNTGKMTRIKVQEEPRRHGHPESLGLKHAPHSHTRISRHNGCTPGLHRTCAPRSKWNPRKTKQGPKTRAKWLESRSRKSHGGTVIQNPYNMVWHTCLKHAPQSHTARVTHIQHGPATHVSPDTMAAHKVCNEHVPHGRNETPESPSRDPKHGQND